MMMFPLTWREAKIDKTSLMMIDKYLRQIEGDASQVQNTESIMNSVLQFKMDNIQNIEELQEAILSRCFSPELPSQFHELNNFMIEGIGHDVPIVPIDMPEVLLRMKIGNDLSLSDLEDMFNIVCNKIN